MRSASRVYSMRSVVAPALQRLPADGSLRAGFLTLFRATQSTGAAWLMPGRRNGVSNCRRHKGWGPIGYGLCWPLWPFAIRHQPLALEVLMKTGTVTIVGRPNVGKSTLLNALLREKIAIISDKPQTTRTRILGVVHLADAQIVLLDTPGLHQAKDRLNQRMVRTAVETMREADLLYVMVEATAAPGPGDRFVIEQVREAISAGDRPAFLLINKVDLVSKPRALPLIEAYRTLMDWNEVVPLSAQTGLNVDRLLELTVKALPEGDPVYGEDVVTDQSMRTLAAEIIREKILQKTRE